MYIKNHSLVLFQGDSVTDAGRSRTDLSDLGPGYPKFVAERFAQLYPDYDVKFLNRACGGDRAAMLLNRLDPDCIDLKPDFVSVLVGCNETLRRYDSGDPTSDSDFQDTYRRIIERILSETDATLMIIEPFILNDPFTASFGMERYTWRSDLICKIEKIRELVKEYHTLYLPLDGILCKYYAKMPQNEISADGVHPIEKGHKIIAEEWLRCCEAI